MIDMSKYTEVTNKGRGTAVFLSFTTAAKTVFISSGCMKYIKQHSDRVKMLVAKDKKSVIVAPCTEGGNKIINKGVVISNTYLHDLVQSMHGSKDNLKFFGEYDKDSKCVVFDITKPYFY